MSMKARAARWTRTFLLLKATTFAGVACSNEVTFLSGTWQVDLASTLADLSGPQDLKLGRDLNIDALSRGSSKLTLRFDGSHNVEIRLGQKTVTRPFEVIKAQGETVALSIRTGKHTYRRVIARLDEAQLALIDSHQRILLKRR